MTNCSEWQSRVGSYVDAELSLPEMEAFRAHLATCTDCAAAALALTESKMAVRRAGNRYVAPPELRAKIFDLARDTPELTPYPPTGELIRRRNSISNLWPRWAIAAAALVLLAAGLFVVASHAKRESRCRVRRPSCDRTRKR